jgi:hypothetical protein
MGVRGTNDRVVFPSGTAKTLFAGQVVKEPILSRR